MSGGAVTGRVDFLKRAIRYGLNIREPTPETRQAANDALDELAAIARASYSGTVEPLVLRVEEAEKRADALGVLAARRRDEVRAAEAIARDAEQRAEQADELLALYQDRDGDGKTGWQDRAESAEATVARLQDELADVREALIAMVYVHPCNCGGGIPEGDCARCRAVFMLDFDPCIPSGATDVGAADSVERRT